MSEPDLRRPPAHHAEGRTRTPDADRGQRARRRDRGHRGAVDTGCCQGFVRRVVVDRVRCRAPNGRVGVGVARRAAPVRRVAAEAGRREARVCRAAVATGHRPATVRWAVMEAARRPLPDCRVVVEAGLCQVGVCKVVVGMARRPAPDRRVVVEAACHLVAVRSIAMGTAHCPATAGWVGESRGEVVPNVLAGEPGRNPDASGRAGWNPVARPGVPGSGREGEGKRASRVPAPMPAWTAADWTVASVLAVSRADSVRRRARATASARATDRRPQAGSVSMRAHAHRVPAVDSIRKTAARPAAANRLVESANQIAAQIFRGRRPPAWSLLEMTGPMSAVPSSPSPQLQQYGAAKLFACDRCACNDAHQVKRWPPALRPGTLDQMTHRRHHHPRPRAL